MSSTQRQSGAVSIFMVIFAILLMSVVTIGFLRIMTSDQNKATGNDLAQSAYDSSQAGVEDAKRALLWYTRNCSGGTLDADCGAFLARLENCNESIILSGVIDTGDLGDTAGGTGTGEIKVQQSTSVDVSGESTDKALDQAYTCVKMVLDTDDVIGSLTANQSAFIPLIGTDQITHVTVEWFNDDDIPGNSTAVDTPTPTISQQLIDTWPANRPPVMRTQFMQVGSSFNLSDFDSTTASSESNANTVFLYPATSGFNNAVITERDIRKDPSGNSVPDAAGSAPLPANCETSVAGRDYACSITLELPTPVRGGQAATSYLRLTSMYNLSHYRISLNGVKFRNVQPSVDSTGRANDVFRRVQSRISLYDTTFPYPDAALDTTGALCKDFGVTDRQYIAGSTSCIP